MSANNYFKVDTESFFFDEKNGTSIRTAWDAAVAYQHGRTTLAGNVPRIAVWKMPTIHGVWTLGALLIGAHVDPVVDTLRPVLITPSNVEVESHNGQTPS